MRLKRSLFGHIFLIFVLSSLFVFFKGFNGIAAAGTPHIVYGRALESDGNAPSDSDLTFNAYMGTRSNDVLTESDKGCGYSNGRWWIEAGNFTNAWTVGKVLHISFTNLSTGNVSKVDIVLNSSGGEAIVFLRMNKGWNLISFCMRPADTSITVVLASIAGKYFSVWSYVGGGVPWEVFDPANAASSDLKNLDAGIGYWINMKQAVILAYSATVASDSIALSNGWNLLGSNSCIAQPITDAMSAIDGKYTYVWAYVDGLWQMLDAAFPGFSDLTLMRPGYGYWAYVTDECNWKVGGSL